MATRVIRLSLFLQRLAENQVSVGQVRLAGDGAASVLDGGTDLLTQLRRVVALPPTLYCSFVQKTGQLVVRPDIVGGQAQRRQEGPLRPLGVASLDQVAAEADIGA